MSEHDVILNTERPATVASLAGDLQQLGVEVGMTLLVHSSLRSIGWVCGGTVAVVQSLQQSIGEAGNLVMPTHSGELSDPAYWTNPAVPTNWWTTIRETMPAFDPAITGTRCMGQIVETFRRLPGAIRSRHPQHSFAAIGPQANKITSEHSYDYSLGEQSPLGRLYDFDASVLLLGVGFDSNTSLHLSEYRCAQSKPIENGAPIMADGRRVWQKLHDIELRSDDFERIGDAFQKESSTFRAATVGQATAMLMSQRELVDFGRRWMEVHR